MQCRLQTSWSRQPPLQLAHSVGPNPASNAASSWYMVLFLHTLYRKFTCLLVFSEGEDGSPSQDGALWGRFAQVSPSPANQQLRHQGMLLVLAVGSPSLWSWQELWFYRGDLACGQRRWLRLQAQQLQQGNNVLMLPFQLVSLSLISSCRFICFTFVLVKCCN